MRKFVLILGVDTKMAKRQHEDCLLFKFHIIDDHIEMARKTNLLRETILDVCPDLTKSRGIHVLLSIYFSKSEQKSNRCMTIKIPVSWRTFSTLDLILMRELQSCTPVFIGSKKHTNALLSVRYMDWVQRFLLQPDTQHHMEGDWSGLVLVETKLLLISRIKSRSDTRKDGAR